MAGWARAPSSLTHRAGLRQVRQRAVGQHCDRQQSQVPRALLCVRRLPNTAAVLCRQRRKSESCCVGGGPSYRVPPPPTNSFCALHAVRNRLKSVRNAINRCRSVAWTSNVVGPAAHVCLQGEFLTFNGKSLHTNVTIAPHAFVLPIDVLQCFRCGKCNNPLGTSNFYDIGGVPHCAACAGQ